MEVLRIVVCDDQLAQRNVQIEYLNTILKEKDLTYQMYTFESGEDLLANYIEETDIIFLDIQMKELDGMETARKIRGFDKKVKIIFTTVIWDYVREGYEVGAFRYLIKPLAFEEYKKEVEACLTEIQKEGESITLKIKGECITLYLAEIIYVEIVNRKVYIHTRDHTISYNKSITALEELLGEENFYRCHVGYLLGINWIKRLELDAAILANGAVIPVSRYRLKPLKEKLLNRLSRVIE